MESHERQDVYHRVTDQIIAAIEAGVARGDNRMPWHHDGQAITTPVNVASCKPYRGVNTLALWAAAQASGYPTGLWGTYRQWQALGAQVRQGEHGSVVVFWKLPEDKDEEKAEAEESGQPVRRILARGYVVFNAAQVDGYTPPAIELLPESERIEHAERFCARLRIPMRHGGDAAFYSPAADVVQMPPFGCFADAVAYSSVLLHECGHATGAKHRLDRDLTGRFGSQAYAMEECIAELVSAMVGADLGLASSPRTDHAGYIASWLEVLHGDARAIFTASSHAQRAADWMHAQQSV